MAPDQPQRAPVLSSTPTINELLAYLDWTNNAPSTSGDAPINELMNCFNAMDVSSEPQPESAPPASQSMPPTGPPQQKAPSKPSPTHGVDELLRCLHEIERAQPPLPDAGVIARVFGCLSSIGSSLPTHSPADTLRTLLLRLIATGRPYPELTVVNRIGRMLQQLAEMDRSQMRNILSTETGIQKLITDLNSRSPKNVPIGKTLIYSTCT